MRNFIDKHHGRIGNVGAIAALTLPILAQAQTFQSIIATLDNILRTIIPVLMVLATLIFLWGVITYITAGGEEEKIKAGRTYMLWGIIALFVMVVVWGLVLMLQQTFGIQAAPIPPGP